VSRRGRPGPSTPARLTAGVLTRLVFGYRPAAWALDQPDQEVPPELLPVLDALFPPGIPWYPASNRC
jgi:hypothetical protein